MYIKGNGVPKNFVIADMWLILAMKQGQPYAASDRRELEKVMTNIQIEEARRLADEWKPKQ